MAYDIAYMGSGQIIVANLRRLIEAKKTNNRAVALKAGLGHTAVRDILLGKIANPRIDTLEKIAGALGVPVAEITGDDPSQALGQPEREMLSVWSQLSEAERRFLLNSARAQIADRGQGSL